jgi:hypothetical protein
MAADDVTYAYRGEISCIGTARMGKAPPTVSLLVQGCICRT